MKTIKDRMLLGAVAGTLGTAAAYLVDTILKKTGYEQRTWAERGKNLVVSRAFDSHKAATVSGVFVTEVIGVLAAVPLVYLHTFTGRDKPLLKGTIYGGMMWLAVYGLGQRAAGPFLSTPGAALSNLASNIVYGTVAASVVTRLGDQSLFSTASTGERRDDESAISDDAVTEWARTNQVQDEQPPVH